jgi:hypothetical protein
LLHLGNAANCNFVMMIRTNRHHVFGDVLRKFRVLLDVVVLQDRVSTNATSEASFFTQRPLYGKGYSGAVYGHAV